MGFDKNPKDFLKIFVNKFSSLFYLTDMDQ